MIDKCNVLIWGKKIGELSYNEFNRLIFVYTNKPPFEISPLRLNTSNNVYDYTLLEQQKGLAGVFSDSLPDRYGDNVLKRYFDKLNTEANTIDKLLFIGNNTMGAITYEPAQDDIKAKQQTMTIGNLYKEAKKLDTKDYYIDLSISINMLKSVSPIGGAKPKAIIGFKDLESDIYIGSKTNELPKGYKYCIIKFNTDGEYSSKDDLLVEYIYMNLAQEVGINTPRTILSQDGHYIIERFDRTQSGKMHMHTLQGYLHSDFSIPRTVDYVDGFVALKNLKVSKKDFEQFYRRMIYNYLLRNHDDHEKNHSFLMDKKGNWRLSPAYDLTYCYKKGGSFVGDHQLTFNGKIGNNITYADFEDIANRYNIKNYKNIIDEIKEIRDSKLIQLLKKYDVSKDKIEEIKKAISEREIRI